MRRAVTGLALLLTVFCHDRTHAQQRPPANDEKVLHEAAVAFVDAYNAKDATALAALFGPEARVETADGTVVVGTEQIKAGFEAAFRDEPEGLISLTMDSLTFLTPDVAVEQGATEFFPDGDTLTSRSKYLVVHLKNEGRWRMVSARSLGEETLSNYEHLRKVQFLLGDWIDEDPDSVVESTVRWEEGKNFLVHEFSVRRGRDAVQKGTHRIGWDPQAKRIRGWVFDSQGGFGETTWEEVEGDWFVKSTGTTPQGENLSATRVMTPDGDRIHVRIIDRVAQGRRLPDIQYTMVRKPPAPRAAAATAPQQEGSR